MARRKSPTTSAPLNAISPVPDKDYAERERKYRAEDALRTLTRAEEIRRDSGLMRDVKAHAKQQMKTTERVLGSRKGK